MYQVSADLGFVRVDLEDAFLFKVLEVQALLTGMLKEPQINLESSPGLPQKKPGYTTLRMCSMRSAPHGELRAA